MIVSLVVPIAVIALIVLLVRRRREGAATTAGSGAASVRRFFQYLLLFGLVVVVAVGASGVLGRALGPGPIRRDDIELARHLAFVAVGGPLLALVTWWSWRHLAADRAERSSPALALTVVLAGVTGLVMVMTSAHSVLTWLLGEPGTSSRNLAVVIVWGVVLAAAWWVSTIITPSARRLLHLAGSVVGVGTVAAGAVALVGEVVSRALFGADPYGYAGGWRSGLAGLLVGLPVWGLFWWRHARRAHRGTGWLAFVMVGGIGGGFVAALVAFSVAVATTLVWVLGDPGTDVPRLHFHDVPSQAAVVIVGLLVWWYHRMVLGEARTAARTGVQRLYEYLMAGIALVTAATGAAVLVAAGLEALTVSGAPASDGAVVNTVLAAVTVLLAGLPVWGVFWRRVGLARRADPVGECGSTVRRTYLALLVGVGAVAAVVAAISGAYQLFEDVVTSEVARSTLLRMRYPIGVVLAAGAVAGGNAVQLRRDRRLLPAAPAGDARQIVLIGPTDPGIVRAVAEATGARVQGWWTDDVGVWRVEDVVAAVGAGSSDAVVLYDEGAPRVIPVRGPWGESRAAP